MVEHGFQIVHAGRTACARLEANDPFDGFHMAEAPLLMAVFDIDQVSPQADTNPNGHRRYGRLQARHPLLSDPLCT